MYNGFNTWTYVLIRTNLIMYRVGSKIVSNSKLLLSCISIFFFTNLITELNEVKQFSYIQKPYQPLAICFHIFEHKVQKMSFYNVWKCLCRLSLKMCLYKFSAVIIASANSKHNKASIWSCGLSWHSAKVTDVAWWRIVGQVSSCNTWFWLLSNLQRGFPMCTILDQVLRTMLWWWNFWGQVWRTYLTFVTGNSPSKQCWWLPYSW